MGSFLNFKEKCKSGSKACAEAPLGFTCCESAVILLLGGLLLSCCVLK